MEVQGFTAEGIASIRVTLLNGEPFFYGVDLARALGYTDTEALTRRIDSEDVTTCADDSSGQLRTYTILSESGLYAAIIGSSKPDAKKFKRWITSDVLPAIRKTGRYEVTPAFSVPQTYAAALRLAAEQQELIEAQAVKLEAQAPAVAFVEKFVEAKQTQPLRAVAKVLQVPEKKFVAWLLKQKILYRLAGKLVPMQIWRDNGYFELKEFVAPHGYANFQMAFTPAGIAWIATYVAKAKAEGELS